VNRGGILAPGASVMKLGENGRGLASRWYPQTLQRRILKIASKRRAITFRQDDGIACMRRLSHDPDTVFFVDPPYTIASKRLYMHSDIDHEKLFRVAATLKGDFLMTYDEVDPIKGLARRFGFDTHTVLMKNTHNRIMRELLIGKNLSWARSGPRDFRQDFLFELS
jgi:DNA adenine methylase